MPVAWIETVAAESASDVVAELYAAVLDPTSGQLDHIMQVHSLHPEGLRAHFELYRAVMRGSRGLRTADREMIALVVSTINQCHY